MDFKSQIIGVLASTISISANAYQLQNFAIEERDFQALSIVAENENISFKDFFINGLESGKIRLEADGRLKLDFSDYEILTIGEKIKIDVSSESGICARTESGN